MWEQVQEELRQLRAQVETLTATPLLFRKDVARRLGISDRTLDRRMKRRDFPKPTYDAGRPKWAPSAFNGQTVSG